MSPARWFATEHLVKDLKGRSVRGGAVTVAGQLLKLALNLAQITILARLLGPQDYGLFNMAAIFAGFLALFQDLGLSTATVQRRDVTHEQVSV
jgi:PST family polysaccharide transporter